jgi:hypothetical protein
MSHPKLTDLWDTLSIDERRYILDVAEISYNTMYQIRSGRRRPGRKTVVRLMKADNRITLQMLWWEDFK